MTEQAEQLMQFVRRDKTTVTCSDNNTYELLLEHHEIGYYKCIAPNCPAKIGMRNENLQGRLIQEHNHAPPSEGAMSRENSSDSDFVDVVTEEATAPPPYQSIPDQNLGQIFVEASLKVGTEESQVIRKSVEINLSRPKELSTVIEEVFYNDSTWHETMCLATAEKKARNAEEFESVLSDYKTTLCENGTRYKITFYDAETCNKRFISKFALELAAMEKKREAAQETNTKASVADLKKVSLEDTKKVPIPDPQNIKDFGCLITVYCEGVVKFRKSLKFEPPNIPTMLSLAKCYCEQACPPNEKQVIASFLKFNNSYDDFVNIDASEKVENAQKYEIMFEQTDDLITANSHRLIVREAAEKTSQKKAVVEAYYTSSSQEILTLKKMVELKDSESVSIMRVISDIFYQDTQWAKNDCYVVVQQYSSEFKRFIDVSGDYEQVNICGGENFKLQFLDAASHSKRKLPRNVIKLQKDSDSDCSSIEEPTKSQVLVDGMIKVDSSTSDFQEVLTLPNNRTMTVRDMADGMYEVHVEPHFPRTQFNVTVSRLDDVFQRHIALKEEYSQVKLHNKESYSVEFMKTDPSIIKKPHSILIPETAFPVEQIQPLKAAPPATSCLAVVKAEYLNSSNTYAPPSFTKLVDFEENHPVTLIKAILTIFYEDTQWGKNKCYAVAEKKAPGFEDHISVASDYENTYLEDNVKYLIKLYDARSFPMDTLPKFCVPLEGEGPEQEPSSQETKPMEVEESEDEDMSSVNFIKFRGYPQRNVSQPKMKTLLKVQCPSRCTSEMLEWVCQKCETPVFYDYADHLHCKCGAHSKRNAAYCCGQDSHGDRFVPHSDVVRAFKSMKKCDEINIVLMGETGAGKSTWIDGIFNYLLHASLDDAIEYDKLEVPIPTQFLLPDDNGQMRKIHVGPEIDNECSVVGASATQRPKSYTFMFRDRFYRFIDVPGVNDCRGIDQDKKNFEMIMQELYNYDRIHAICILIPADATRLTVAMKYCINELLTHLHQDAAKNLVFCFTKSRVNFYRPGNTQEILQSYMKSFKEKRNVDIPLTDQTMYYFDNESFKFICALQNGIESFLEMKQDYVKSWDVSAQSTYKVLDYIASLQPHMIRDMMSLNEAKRIILELTPISAEITKNIQTNKRIIEAKKLELQEMKKQTVDLKSQLAIKQTTLQAEPIDYPKTVCAGAECIESLGIPGTSESQVLYRTICHDHCYLENIEPGKYPNPGLQHCWAMSGGTTCHQCNCSWETHLHIRYEQKQVTIDVPNKEVEKVLASKNTDEVKVSDVIKGLETRLEELTLKEKRIKTICAKFVAFLNKNAIAVINDAYGEYLEQSIKLAKNEVAVTGEGNEKVEQLEKYLAEYREEVAIINDHIAKGTENITVTSIEAMKDELQRMDELGKQFTSFLKASEESQKNYQREDEVHLYSSGGGFMKSLMDAGKTAINWAIGKKQKKEENEWKKKRGKR
ncbi:hypothetical protein QR680_004434 [Steinernema hermaphroditum]|uniref:DUF8206 domain-containing protein n=1 Tax=Steinernema hermaphroditum TaxID=289476 RepID=A0AA39HQZ6_9BILA|nr:hypothetical protein QR680_004434 [Steinernema hermaphroditum]